MLPLGGPYALNSQFFEAGSQFSLRRSGYTVLALWLFVVIASPYPTHSLVSRDTINCTDLTADFDSSCWYRLGLSDYLVHPTTGWIYTFPTCTENGTGADCCKPGVAW